MIQSSLANYRHELLLANFAGISILQQHGSADDNVPAFHSRRLSQLISQQGYPSKYVELDGKGHWFDGVMTTTCLRKYYDEILVRSSTYPELPHKFDMNTSNPASVGSRGGIFIDQLVTPGQLGRMEVQRSSEMSTWSLKTSNILRFHFSSRHLKGKELDSIVVDGSLLRMPTSPCPNDFWFLRSDEGSWEVRHDPQRQIRHSCHQISNEKGWRSLQQRHGAQMGTIDSLLFSNGRFLVHSPHEKAFDIALQISRNLFQYFAADVKITEEDGQLVHHKGNIINVALGSAVISCSIAEFPITVDQDHGLSVSINRKMKKVYDFEEGLGAILLRPLPDERLELLIWGFDLRGLQQAARLLPMMTGVGQPDFVITSKRCAWKGAAGVHAMGFFDNFWQVSENSFID